MAPLTCDFKTKRGPENPNARGELIVKGDFGQLLWASRTWDWKAPPQSEDEEDEASRVAKEHNHKRAIADAVETLAKKTAAVPTGMVEQLRAWQLI